MKTTIILLILLLCASPVLSDYLYCSMPNDVYVYHFDVSLHTLDEFEHAGSTKQGFNYLEITDFVIIGPSEIPGYTVYRVMDVSFIPDDIPYRISIIAADEKLDFRDAPAVNRWVYGHTGISEPLFVNLLESPVLIIKHIGQ